ncbi:hypothetical protein [Robinsoniella sp. KNHs210]|uniref:hypothetical protein n=1 Tax=Robinsoniella sp. KNHs210 TaxID=1469950 RepID=UPI000485B63C|nr:hypothetical protein [Robinsoniella sp. KNHs210]
MNFLEKIRLGQEEIDSRYDMSIFQMNEIKNGSPGICDMISYSFRYGYMQGTKAERSHRKTITKPIHKNDYRRAIAGNADKIKNVFHLKTLHRLSEEFANDEVMEQNGFYKYSIVNKLTNGDLSDSEILSVHYLISGILSRKGRKG